MNKSAIQRFAIWARTELIAQVSQRAYQYGITKDGYGEHNAVTVGGRALSTDEQRQRKELVDQIRNKGYTQVMEEVAYTWFNRFIALRFMEVNNYLPSHIRVFSDSTGAFKPEILNDVLHLDLPGLNEEKVAEYIESNRTEDLYRYLLLTQCNALNEALPWMFEKMGGFTELLLPNNILKQDGILGRMVSDIPEEDWMDQVEIIGWLYQYYNTDLFNAIFDGDKSRKSLRAEDIPSATQLFTPDWAVRYMVENSLGKLWLEGHPNDVLKGEWKYYLDDAVQDADVQARLEAIRVDYCNMKPHDIKIIDPCVGSGHILVYAFDVLIQIYKIYGISERDAVRSVLENNLFGLDIDDRAAQLAYFAVMMKARQYDRRIFSRGIQPHVYAIVESNGLDCGTIEYFTNNDPKLIKDFGALVDELRDAKEYGSILNISQVDFAALYARIDEVCEDISIFREMVLNTIEPIIKVAEVMASQYDVVITNPPYLNSARMGDKLLKYIKENYEEAKADFSSVMYLCAQRNFSKRNGYISFITTNSWMYLKSFVKVREISLKKLSFASIVDYGTELFDGKIGHLPIVAWVSQNTTINRKLTAVRLVNYRYGRRAEKHDEYFNRSNYYYAKQEDFFEIDGAPVVYWFSSDVLKSFENQGIGTFAEIVSGMTTGDNDKYLRQWTEADITRIAFQKNDVSEINLSATPWIPYHKGGEQRKWYGNHEYIVNWSASGQFNRAKTTMTHVYLKPCITWSDISGNSFAGRYCYGGFMFDVKGSCAFADVDKLKILIGLFNSKITPIYVEALNPTSTTQVGDLKRIPYIAPNDEQYDSIKLLVDETVILSQKEWDSFEFSWDYSRHPLVPSTNDIREQMASQFRSSRMEKYERISWHYEIWQKECDDRFYQVKANEEELNRIFIEIYGLQNELTPEVADKDVTVHCIYNTKEDVPESLKGSNYVRTKRDEIVSLISYAVGCMFGRYSLDVEGLAYAGGEWDASKYSTIIPDKDNIIPICDDDYFDDDITGRFVKWVETVYGSDTLEENLKFIADALGGKGTPREVIRSYFLNDFYADHCKIYQKRPIYWLFDSGKKNGFKALIYMHRYQSDLLARMRTDYVHEQQERYRTQLAHLGDALEHASGSERVKLTKQQKKIQDQALEIQKYEEKIHHLADQNISIDLDDGVKHNYALFVDVLAKIK
ncbi:MAG: hypothetical protein EUB_02246 [Eubacterium sp.]|uniref:BREX-1 system adenine-specific DNA-methyltransferase PglX n=1 Tax=Eubacterium sp. TaxID=142586 RepID=UPI0030392CCA